MTRGDDVIKVENRLPPNMTMWLIDGVAARRFQRMRANGAMVAVEATGSHPHNHHVLSMKNWVNVYESDGRGLTSRKYSSQKHPSSPSGWTLNCGETQHIYTY